MLNTQPTFPDETLAHFFPYQDKMPTCDNLRNSVTILAFRHRDEERDDWRYIDAGCGKVYLCHSCAINYNERKYRYTLSLTQRLFEAFPKLKLAHIVLTVPHDHPWTLEEGPHVYSQMFKAAKKTIFTLFPDCASLMVLHTWSSDHPTEQHLHIHCLVYAVNSSGELLPGYIDTDALNDTWRDSIGYQSGVYAHSKYFGKHQTYRIMDIIKYNLRSPIQDWCAKSLRPLTASYLHRVKYLHRVHRIRWFGWLAPRVMHAQLAEFGIFEIQDDSEKEWIFSHAEYSQFGWDGNHLLMMGDTELSRDEVTNISEVMPTKFFRFERPPP